jgi:hypothetical protein
VGSCALRNLVIRPRLNRVNEIWELNGILDEEDGYVVAHNIKIAFISVSV